jgi:glycosyltransferase involved in cell wall biosynthesis
VAAEVIPLGVPPQAARTTARDEGPPWRLVHVASINAVKDHTTLLHAMALVAAEEPRVHLDVIGEDTLGGKAQQLAASLGLTDRVTFRGFQTTDVVTTSLARAHLHVVSSRHEAAGVTVLEAALAGTPTVGTAVGYIADGAPSRAVSVPVANPSGLSTAVIALLRDRAHREQLAAAAMSWAAAHDADATANAFERVYSTLNIRP